MRTHPMRQAGRLVPAGWLVPAGCVRVTNAAMDWLWRNGNLPVGQTVWVY